MNVDIFIIRVGLELINIDTIHILIRYEHDSLTQIDTPTQNIDTAMIV